MKSCAKLHRKQQAITACALLLTITPAFAAWDVAEVTPDSKQEEGVTVQAERRKDETIAFTITRYLAKGEQEERNPDGKITRRAALEVRNKTSQLASTEVSATAIEGALVYKFTLAPTCAPYSKFSLYERAERKLGGEMYELNLPACIAFVQRRAPEHP